jgi:hypothetical protein
LASIKATFDGIGAGGGVAWPLFGILFSTLGLAAGATLTVIIGLTAGFLFLAVCLPAFYLSYKNSSREDHALREKLTKRRELLNNAVFNYLQSLYEQHLNTFAGSIDDVESNELIKFITDQIVKDYQTNNKSFFLRQLFTHMRCDKQLVTDFVHAQINDTNSSPAISQCISRFIGSLPQKKAPITRRAGAAFIGFVGAFGVVAGCSSGVLGVLTGMSVFAGIAAFPILGWGILSIAVLVSFLVAIAFMCKIDEKFQLKQERSTIKELNQSLNHVTSIRDDDVNRERIFRRLAESIDSQIALGANECKQQLKATLLSELFPADSMFNRPRNEGVVGVIPAETVSKACPINDYIR